MNTRRLFLLLFAAGALCAQPAQRIISTAPSITELLYALGLGDRIVGVDRFSHYPPEAANKPQIGDYAAPNLEVIATLRPDLVIIPTNPVRLKDRLEALRLKVLELDQEGIPQLYRSFDIVGRATGTEAEAARMAASVKAQLDAIRAKTAGKPRARVMYVVGRTPNRLDGLIVMGQASYLNEVIEIAGGVNVFRDAPAAYPRVSLEEVLARNPDVIVDMGEMGQTIGVTDTQKRAVVALWQRMGTLAAVKAGRVHAVASDVFVVPGPRVVEAARAFLEMLHPEAR
jgi:iron complex transport system substrate-binding protein